MRSSLLTALLALSLATGCGAVGQNGDGGTQNITSAKEANLPDRIATGEIPQPRLETRPVVIRGAGEEVRVEAEIADDDSERTRGLMAREELGENEGMLFVFDSESSLRFIMDNTLLQLSIAYLSSDGSIVDIQRMRPMSEQSYPSAEPARYALEVNQGFFERRGIEAGDEADLP